MKRALILGAGGFIGSHMAKRLKKENFWIRGVDLKYPEFSKTCADEFVIGDLRDPLFVKEVMFPPTQKNQSSKESFDEVYQFAADMGGAGYIFTGENDANVMHNSASINLNVAHYATLYKIKRLFYSSSACIYPAHNQEDPENPMCTEESAYPANPDSEYGWEKLFSERLYLAFFRNYNLPIRIARYHNIFGPEGTWDGGKEKAPAALCRKVAFAKNGESIEVWGDGLQTRSFLYIDECIEATLRLTRSNFIGPVNIGSEELISISDLARLIIKFSGKNINLFNIAGQDFIEKYGFKCPVGVRGRNSDNKLYKEKIGWEVNQPLTKGIEITYKWIEEQVKKQLT